MILSRSMSKTKIKNNEIRHGRHCVFNLHVHLVFVTKYRKKIFNKDCILILESLFSKVCDDFDAQLIEIDGEADHIHLLIHYPPKVALSKLVNSLKGVSSRMLMLHYPTIKHYYYNDVLWSPSYFAASCGGASTSIIKQYIEQQQTPL